MDNTKDTLDIVTKIIGVVFMLLIASRLRVPGVLIDLLLLGMYYEMTSYSGELANDVGSDEKSLKHRIAVLEKKLADKERKERSAEDSGK